MLIEEAKWLSWEIAKLDPAAVYPMLNLGSSTAEFRSVHQPWIDRYLFAPAREKKLTVIHADIRQDAGVDIVGDISDARFEASLARLGIKSVLCSNLLEHVADREPICAAIGRVVSAGGYVIVSVPFLYPFHRDPIDTMFRPSVDELTAAFPGFSLQTGATIQAGTFMDLYRAGYGQLFKDMIRAAMATSVPRSWPLSLAMVPHLIRKFQVTCAVLQKQVQ